MKKNELIKKLQTIRGNPEVLIENENNNLCYTDNKSKKLFFAIENVELLPITNDGRIDEDESVLSIGITI